MPGSHGWRERAASQTAQQLRDNATLTFAVLDRPAVDQHMWGKAEYARALDLINRGYEKLIVAQIIGRTLKELNSKLHYEQMEESKRQQRREQIDELKKRALSSTPERAAQELSYTGAGGRAGAGCRVRGAQSPAGS